MTVPKSKTKLMAVFLRRIAKRLPEYRTRCDSAGILVGYDTAEPRIHPIVPMPVRATEGLAAATSMLALAVLTSASGCKQRETTAQASTASPPQLAVATAALATAPSHATASASRTVDGAERARLAAYQKALGDGRRATKAAKFKEAATAFDAALVARPDDSRAYAERGYAAYLAKSYGRAEDDLSRAAQGTDNRQLRAQVFYNLGLVREARGRDGTSAFALSNFLHKTAAAQKKLTGKETCPIEVERNPQSDEPVQYRDWLAFYTEYRDAFLHGDTKPEANAAARQLLCGTAGCEGTGPWLIDIEARKSFLVSEIQGSLSVATVALTWQMGGLNFCYPTVEAKIIQRKGDRIVVRAHIEDGTPTVICDPTGNSHPCTEQELAEQERSPDSQDWVRGCDMHSYSRFKVFDTSTGKWTMTVTQYDDIDQTLKPSERVQVQLDDTGIVATGPNCRLHLPLSTAP